MIKKKYLSMLACATLTSVVNALMIISDAIICGVFLGDTAISAINLVTPCLSLWGSRYYMQTPGAGFKKKKQTKSSELDSRCALSAGS